MIRARIGKRFTAARESAPFTLDVEFEAAAGVTVLFGASGSGKTLTLDCIAGFAKPDSGRIIVDDRVVFDAEGRVDLPARQRNCGYVFQNYALFPHMTIRQNVEFAAGRGPAADDMLERFRLAEFAGRRPHEVSGGQKQRCSIARALVANPRVLLFDEPARGLDAPLRADLYALLRELRSDFQVPIILVTHDLQECFAIGDTVLVYQNGRIVQRGSARDIVDHPANADVARLLG